MSEKSSPQLRIAAKHERDAMLMLPTEDELFELSHKAVGEIVAGMTVKAQINQAWINLGRPPMWRLLSAWYRDGSASWSAQAVRDFQRRYLAWQEREAARRTACAATERARQAASDRAAIERYLAHHRAEAAKLEARLASIGKVDPA